METTHKICPLTLIGTRTWLECREIKCTLWDEDNEICRLINLIEAIEKIASK